MAVEVDRVRLVSGFHFCFHSLRWIDECFIAVESGHMRSWGLTRTGKHCFSCTVICKAIAETPVRSRLYLAHPCWSRSLEGVTEHHACTRSRIPHELSLSVERLSMIMPGPRLH